MKLTVQMAPLASTPSFVRLAPAKTSHYLIALSHAKALRKCVKKSTSEVETSSLTFFGDFYGTNTITVRREEPPCVKGFG